MPVQGTNFDGKWTQVHTKSSSVKALKLLHHLDYCISVRTCIWVLSCHDSMCLTLYYNCATSLANLGLGESDTATEVPRAEERDK